MEQEPPRAFPSQSLPVVGIPRFPYLLLYSQRLDLVQYKCVLLLQTLSQAQQIGAHRVAGGGLLVDLRICLRYDPLQLHLLLQQSGESGPSMRGHFTLPLIHPRPRTPSLPGGRKARPRAMPLRS